jgi:hypothetical protein
MDERDDRNGTVEQEFTRRLAGGDAELAVNDGEVATGVARSALLEVAALRQLLQRVQQRKLEPEDWALLRAVVEETQEELESSNTSLTF